MTKKQLTVIKSKTTKVVNRANALEVSNQEQFEEAANVLTDIKAVAKLVKADREKLTKPLNDALKEIRDRYRPFETDLKEGEAIVKEKLADYQTKLDEELEKKEAEIRSNLASGDMTPEEAANEMEDQEAIGTSVDTKRGSVQFKTIRKVRVADVTKVPAEYLNDERVIAAITTAVRKDALDGKEIAGIEVYEDKSVAGL